MIESHMDLLIRELSNPHVLSRRYALVESLMGILSHRLIPHESFQVPCTFD